MDKKYSRGPDFNMLPIDQMHRELNDRKEPGEDNLFFCPIKVVLYNDQGCKALIDYKFQKNYETFSRILADPRERGHLSVMGQINLYRRIAKACNAVPMIVWYDLVQTSVDGVMVKVPCSYKILRLDTMTEVAPSCQAEYDRYLFDLAPTG